MKRLFSLAIALLAFPLIVLSEDVQSKSAGDMLKVAEEYFAPYNAWEAQYEEAEYDKYNSPASENGLSETLIKITGKVVSVDNLNDEFDVWIVAQKDEKKWGVAVSVGNDKPDIGSMVDCYGVYLGQSRKLGDLPNLILTRFKTVSVIESEGVAVPTLFEK